MFDLLIKGARVVDGTGTPSYTADIGINGERIAEIGQLGNSAKKLIAADGLVAAPGAIDVHTHYDAQVTWDGPLAGSAAHGVTTVILGNCGIGIAPCLPEHREVVMKDLVVLEGIPYDVLEKGIDWKFQTFPQYMDFMRQRGIGVNVGALVPLSTLRRFTLGDEATERAATEVERNELASNLREAMRAGALGFSASLVPRHTGYMGRPLPCRLADMAELQAYAQVVREMGFGAIQVNVISSIAQPTDAELALIEMLLDTSGRTVTYSGAMYRNDAPESIDRMLEKVEYLRKKGGIPQTTISPIIVEVDLRAPMVFADTPAFKKVLNRPVEEQMRVYRDVGWRNDLRRELAEGGRLFSGSWKNATVFKVHKGELTPLLNRSVSEIAAERGADLLDVFLDIALADDLQLKYLGSVTNTSQEHLSSHIKDPRVLYGLGDAGAHVDMLFMGGYPTHLLGHWVREKKAISLELAIKRMSSEPADYFGFSDRGRVKVGKAADLMIFDPETVGSEERANRTLYDLPGGAGRLYADPSGMRHVMVNGTPVITEGRYCGSLPGHVINGAS